MLPRQPLRFLLADDPGAGKTIMAGLLIKELLIRGDLERCLIVAPGNLVEQWQEEMAEKFGLAFDILSRDQIEASLTGNPFIERNRLIVRLDMAARSDELKAKFEASPDMLPNQLLRQKLIPRAAHAVVVTHQRTQSTENTTLVSMTLRQLRLCHCGEVVLPSKSLRSLYYSSQRRPDLVFA